MTKHKFFASITISCNKQTSTKPKDKQMNNKLSADKPRVIKNSKNNLNTWDRPRTDEELRKFVATRLAKLATISLEG